MRYSVFFTTTHINMELQEKINLIKNNEAVALLAPTFCIDFKYPNIIGMLEHLGFKEVTELKNILSSIIQKCE